MKNLPKIKYRFERLSSEIYAVRPHENNQQVRIDCLEPSQRKISLSVNIVVALTFMCSIIKIPHWKYSPSGDV